MRTTSLLASLSFLLPLATLRAGAQAPSPVAAGQLVRIELGRDASPFLRGYRTSGELERLDADSLVLRVAGGGVTAIPRGAVGRLEVHRGRRGYSRGEYIAIGTLTGAVGGALVGAAAGSVAGDDDNFFGPEFPEVLGAVAGGAIGVLGGLIWGTSRSLDRWERVPLSPSLRVGLAATPRRVGLAITVRAMAR